jgi:hypothetical protein
MSWFSEQIPNIVHLKHSNGEARLIQFRVVFCRYNEDEYNQLMLVAIIYLSFSGFIKMFITFFVIFCIHYVLCFVRHTNIIITFSLIHEFHGIVRQGIH